jgi:hypothetical protein
VVTSAQPTTAAQANAPRSSRKASRPSRVRVEKRDPATPVARKVTIRTAVSKPTTPRKKKADVPAPQTDVVVAPAGSDVPIVAETVATTAALDETAVAPDAPGTGDEEIAPGTRPQF